MTIKIKVSGELLQKELDKYLEKINAMIAVSTEGETPQLYKLILMEKVTYDALSVLKEQGVVNKEQFRKAEDVVDDYLEKCTSIEFNLKEGEV